VIRRMGRRHRCSRASKIEWEIEGIEGIEGSGFKPRVARVLSCGEADGGGSGREGEDGRMTRPSSRARGGVGEGLKRRMVEEGAARGLYRRRKRRRARARALPDLAAAKPGGDDTTPKIIILI
jgi:hypothetical protein